MAIRNNQRPGYKFKEFNVVPEFPHLEEIVQVSSFHSIVVMVIIDEEEMCMSLGKKKLCCPCPVKTENQGRSLWICFFP